MQQQLLTQGHKYQFNLPNGACQTPCRIVTKTVGISVAPGREYGASRRLKSNLQLRAQGEKCPLLSPPSVPAPSSSTVTQPGNTTPPTESSQTDTAVAPPHSSLPSQAQNTRKLQVPGLRPGDSNTSRCGRNMLSRSGPHKFAEWAQQHVQVLPSNQVVGLCLFHLGPSIPSNNAHAMCPRMILLGTGILPALGAGEACMKSSKGGVWALLLCRPGLCAVPKHSGYVRGNCGRLGGAPSSSCLGITRRQGVSPAWRGEFPPGALAATDTRRSLLQITRFVPMWASSVAD